MLQILTDDYWILDLDAPLRVGDFIQWWVEEVSGRMEIFDAVVPETQVRAMWILTGVDPLEYDPDDTAQMARGVVTAIEEIRYALRPALTPMVGCWEDIPGSARLIERSELDPAVAEPFDPDDHHGGYLLTIDGDVSEGVHQHGLHH